MIITKDNISEVRQFIEDNVKDNKYFCCPEIIGKSIFVHFGVGNAYILDIGSEVSFDENNQIKIKY